MDRDFDRANDASRERLEALAATLGPADVAVGVGGGWTISTVFAHLAFWDRWQEARWRGAFEAGLAAPPDLPDALADVVNGALTSVLAAVPGSAALHAAIASAESVDRLIRGLPDASVAAALDPEHERLLDRSVHRLEHIEQIARARARARAER